MHRLGRVGIAVAGGALLLAGVVEYSIRRTPVPAVPPPPATSVLLDRRGAELGTVANTQARECLPIALRDMGPWLPLVTVAIEDRRFWHHPGLDFYSATGAALQNLRSRRIVSGASTITQQLVKLATNRQGRAWSAKFREALAALHLERSWSKEEILVNYLNRIDYGNRRLGAEAAARAYFGKRAKDLTLAEAIFLAGLPQSPSRLNPWTRPQEAKARYERNVRRMAASGLLPAGADAEALLRGIPTVGRFDPPTRAAHFARLIDARAPRVTTTIDLPTQEAAENMLREHLARLGGQGVQDGAVVILDNATGEVRALACAGDYSRRAINSALEPRSCGSTLKPFLYAAALDRRLVTAASLLPDTAEAITGEYRDYDPQNYSKRYLGPVRLREALGNSLNVPAVVVLSQLGARDTFRGFARWGLKFPQGFDAYGAGFILGNAPVRLLDLAAAYSALARQGEAWNAKLTAQQPIEARRAASPEAAAIIIDILCDNAARQISFGPNSPLALDQRTAVKTGTSSGFRDGWCVGFNRDHTVAVWSGNLDGRSMGELLAVRSAAPLWASLMQYLYAKGDQPLPAMQETENLHALTVAVETGLLPRENERTVREWFIPGTEPHENAATRYRNGVLQLPAEYAAWCASSQNRLRAEARNEKLAILYPKDGAVFALNSNLPKSQQVLPLQSSDPACEWYLNGEKLAKPMIPLQPGDWSLTAKDGLDEAVVSFRVE